jgi:hypothetical protein
VPFHANVFICVSRQLEKYKAIEGKTVAKAMFKIAQRNDTVSKYMNLMRFKKLKYSGKT